MLGNSSSAFDAGCSLKNIFLCSHLVEKSSLLYTKKCHETSINGFTQQSAASILVNIVNIHLFSLNRRRVIVLV